MPALHSSQHIGKLWLLSPARRLRLQDRERVEREAKVELLNETSFDRRRQVAVYKQDGGRGHHMQVGDGHAILL